MSNKSNLVSLPIDSHRSAIEEWLRSPSKSIADAFLCIVAETGAGKSTRVPRFLLDAGATVLVTQPRRIAARMVAERVAEELGEELGRTVGYRTASGDDRCDSAATKCLFVTDGLALVRELLGSHKHNVLVLDEVHEWNLNIEVLLAYVRGAIERREDFRVVLMSATLDSAALRQYLGGCQMLSVEGRTFAIEEQKPSKSEPSALANVASDVTRLTRAGRNVLVFQPGKREIEECCQELSRRQVRAFGLHGEMSKEDQRAAVRAAKTGRGVAIVATNVAQTSLTIDGIDAVVDTGTTREMHVTNGIEVLRLVPVSRADRKQRAGRAGRTRPGIYIPHGPEATLDFPIPEIQRTALDSAYLRLLDAGYQPDGLNFFHAPKAEEWSRVKTLLTQMDLIDGGGITQLGTQALRMGLEPRLARMILEGQKRGVLADVVRAAAIIANPIADRRIEERGKPVWTKHVNNESRSDILAQMSLLCQIEKDPRRVRELGCHGKSVFEALMMVRELKHRLERTVPRFTSSGDKDQILKSLIAGSPDRIYKYSPTPGRPWYSPADPNRRNAGNDSIVREGEWRLGTPVPIQTQRGTFAHLLTGMSAVKQEWLTEVLPHLMIETASAYATPVYSPELDSVMLKSDRCLAGHVIDHGQIPCQSPDQIRKGIAGWLASL